MPSLRRSGGTSARLGPLGVLRPVAQVSSTGARVGGARGYPRICGRGEGGASCAHLTSRSSRSCFRTNQAIQRSLRARAARREAETRRADRKREKLDDIAAAAAEVSGGGGESMPSPSRVGSVESASPSKVGWSYQGFGGFWWRPLKKGHWAVHQLSDAVGKMQDAPSMSGELYKEPQGPGQNSLPPHTFFPPFS